jgi:hypothetical protein
VLPRDILAAFDQPLDVVLGIDLGELVDGRRVVALGLAFGAVRTDLHYAFVPAYAGAGDELRHWCWELGVRDDLGTDYEGGSGAFDAVTPGAWSHGSRDIVPGLNPEAGWVELSCSPSRGDWTPPDARARVVELRRDDGSVHVRYGA